MSPEFLDRQTIVLFEFMNWSWYALLEAIWDHEIADF
jgi:hypothetical protein